MPETPDAKIMGDGDVGLMAVIFTQASIVKSPEPNDRPFDETKIESFRPSKLKACPTFPVAKVVPFTNEPLLTPIKSLAFPSALYHATKLLGCGAQVCVQVCANACGADANPKSKASIRL